MSDYKRWISYIYNYEKNIKKNNIGYVRVETRGEMTKLTLHINVLSVIDPMNVYMIYRNKKTGLTEGIKIGLITMERGVGHGVYSTYTNDIMGTGLGIKDIGGLVVFHEKDRFYASEWDDIEINIDKFIEYRSNYNQIEEEQTKQEEAAMQEEMQMKQEEAAMQEEIQMKQEEVAMQEEMQMKQEEAMMQEEMQMKQEEVAMREEMQMKQEEAMMQEEMQLEQGQVIPGQVEDIPGGYEQLVHEEDITTKYFEDIESFGNTEGLFEHQENNAEKRLREAAENMLRTYPYMYPFEEDDIDACVRIEPKDIENLPINTWIIANNSFLLKGYYGYRHLIFFKIGKDKPRYMIGVPGINHNRENFIANMFGFRLFRPIKNTREVKGEYGYWCIVVDNR